MAPPRKRSARQRARRPLAVLALAAFALGLGGGAASAQDATAGGPTGEDLFGGYLLSGRANGVQLTYDTPGSFPVASPIFQASVPEAIATMSGGPTTAALASVAYPGPVIADIGSLLNVASGQNTGIPQYPIASRSNYPSGPDHDTQAQPDGTTMKTITSAINSNAYASYSGSKAPPAMAFGSLLAVGDSSILAKAAVARSHAEASDIKIADGLFTIESVVTDLVATTNGTAGASSGTTVVRGMRFLGLDVVVDRDGLRLAEAPAGGPAPPALGPLGQALAPVTGPLATLVKQVRDQKAGILDGVLGQAGITVKLMDPVESVDGSSATRSANGLIITFTYEGDKQAQLNQLVNLIPPQLRGSIGGQIPNPVNFLVANHIGGMAIAPASVTSTTSPSFVVDDVVSPDIPVDTSGVLGATGGDAGSFDTPLPPLSASGGASGAAGAVGQPEGIASALASALPAGLILVLVATSPFFAFGSSKLADNVLNVAETSCPLGLEKPPPPPQS